MTDFKIVTQEEWGRVYLGGWNDRPIPAETAWLHKPVVYGGPGEFSTFEEDAAYVRRLEEIGYSRFGPHNGTTWDPTRGIGAGISYSYIVMRSGRIFAGHDIEKQSSHTAGHNTTGIGICMSDGVDKNDPPTISQVNATAWLLNEVVRLGYLDEPVLMDGGHRDVYATDCPTDVAYNLLTTINTLAATGGTMALRKPTQAVMFEIEALLKSWGFVIYCGPSDWKAGRCKPGLHGHSSDSRHFLGLAVDFGWGSSAISNMEALLVEIAIEMLRKRYPDLALRFLWNVGPGNHEDHGHVDDNGLNWNSVVRPRSGVRAADGSTLFVPVAMFKGAHVPPINHGLTQKHVQTVQKLLTQLKYYTGSLDGYHGQQTTAAVTAAQRALGITADGKGGPGTLAALQKAGKPVTDPYEGFTKTHITKTQVKLKALGFYTGDIDGLPGPLFRSAVTKFQTKYRLEADGLPGPATTAALDRAYQDYQDSLKPDPEPAPAPAPKPEPTPEPEPAPEPAPVDLDELAKAVAARLTITYRS